MRRSHLPPEHWMLQVTCRQRASLPASLEGILRVHRDGGRCKAMADNFVADGVAQIINPLWIGKAAGYRSPQVREAQRKLGAVQVRRRSLLPSLLPLMVAGVRYESHTGGAC